VRRRQSPSMAPKAAGQKRKAAAHAAPAGSSRKKLAVVDPIKEKCTIVAAAIKDAELEDDVRSMLHEIIPGSLGVAIDVRHKFQTSVVGMVGETMASVEAACKARLEQAQLKVDGAVADKAQRDAKVVEEEGNMTSKIAGLADKQEVCKRAAAALVEAEHELKEALSAQKKAAADLQATTTQRERLDEAKSGVFGPMKESAADAAAVNKLSVVAKKFGCDESLVTSLPTALQKAPADRGTFDGLALRQFDEWLDKTIAGLVETVANGDAAASERAAAVTAATASRDAAVEQDAAATGALADAKSAQKEAGVAVKVAQRAVKSFEVEQREAAKVLASAKEKVSDCAAAMAAFHELESRTTTAPAPQSDESPAAAAAALA